MVNKLGIIPAAGAAVRFAGLLKELLPISDQMTLLLRTVRIMQDSGCDAIVVITNTEKAPLHMQHLEKEQNVFFCLQKQQKDIWGAVVEALPLSGYYNLFAMPDTCYPTDAFTELPNAAFVLGCHSTDMPERFGVLQDNRIVNKQHLPQGTYNAWGTLSWSIEVAKHWLQNLHNINTYTEAFNIAMKYYSYAIKDMAYYYDLAAFEDYKRLLQKGEL